ncbi:hypothetical protein RB597_000724 [Gaeumannomyces tritici]
MRAYDFHQARATYPASSFLFPQGSAEADDGVADMTNSHKRGPWSQAEDHQLMTLVSHQGALNWVRIAQFLGTRTPKQCRERYHQNLKPSLNHEPISPEEGVQIERMVHEMGKRWAEIARRLHNRSDNAVKNWWNGSQNRRKRDGRRKSSYGGYHHHHQHVATSQQQQQHCLSSPIDSAPAHHHQQQHQQHHHHHYHHQDAHPAAAAAAAAAAVAPSHHHHHNPHARSLLGYDMPEPSYSRVGPLPMRSLADIPRILPNALPPLTRALPRPLSPTYSGRQYDTPLPSPSALSPGADSVDGGPAPSLMSDNGSSYSTSPRASNRDLGSPIDLPPLKNLSVRRGSRSYDHPSHHPHPHPHPHHHHPYQRPGSLSPSDVKLPGFSSLTAYKPTASSELYSPRTHNTHLPTAPSSPVNNLPALRMPQSPQQQHAICHRSSASRDRLGISSLIS